MGFYWSHSDIQNVFYPDVQEICEEIFADYLSPLQGAFEMFYENARQNRSRLRTDKQTVVLERDKIIFYLFLTDNVALVKIEDRGETYNTSAKILSKEEVKKIKMVEIPPTNGIGIARIQHVPEEKNYAIHKVVTETNQIKYSKGDIQLLFDCDTQRLAVEAFGDYVQPL